MHQLDIDCFAPLPHPIALLLKNNNIVTAVLSIYTYTMDNQLTRDPNTADCRLYVGGLPEVVNRECVSMTEWG